MLPVLDKLRSRLFRLRIEIPYPYQDILGELERISWHNPKHQTYSGLDLWDKQRNHCLVFDDKFPLLREIQHNISNDRAKLVYIDSMLDNVPDIAWEYDFDRDRLFQCTRLHAELVRDAPGFVNVLHTDNRLLVATGMVYLTERDDPDVSTVFYTSHDRDDPLRMTTDLGQGWWHLNGNHTYHEGWNRTNAYRYTFLLALTLNVTPINNDNRRS